MAADVEALTLAEIDAGTTALEAMQTAILIDQNEVALADKTATGDSNAHRSVLANAITTDPGLLTGAAINVP